MSSPKRINRSNVIAFVWDFDETLIRGYMQQPLFMEKFAAHPMGAEEMSKLFWKDVHATEAYWKQRAAKDVADRRKRGETAHEHNVLKENVYLERLFAWMREPMIDGTPPPLAGLTLDDLRRAGAGVSFYDGVIELLQSLKNLPNTDPRLRGFSIEHYVVSTGFAETIRGSAINDHINGIFGTEFADAVLPPGACGDEQHIRAAGELTWPKYPMNHALKTQALFEINKGVALGARNRLTELLHGVDDRQPDYLRHVPWGQMVYSADGPSDIPAFALLQERGGLTVAIWDPNNHKKLTDSLHLQKSERVTHTLMGDFRPGSATWAVYHEEAAQIAQRVVRDRRIEEEREVKKAVQHSTGDDQVVPDWFAQRPEASAPKIAGDVHDAGRANQVAEPPAPAIGPRAIEFGSLYD